MTELQVWVLLIGVLVLAGGWLACVGWLRYVAITISRQPRKVQIVQDQAGANLEGQGDNPDWKEAEREAMLLASKRIKRAHYAEADAEVMHGEGL